MCVCDYYTTRTKTNTINYCSSFSLLLLFIVFILQFPFSVGTVKLLYLDYYLGIHNNCKYYI